MARALQPTVSDTQELESPASLPTLAVIPESEAQQRLMDGRLKDEVVEDFGTHRLLVRAAPEDPASESLRSVHLSLMLRARSMTAKIVLITSPSSGTGKAFVAANLAALMAENGKRVLLIEADLRKPGIQKFVGLDPLAPGLSDLLSDKRTLDEVVHRHPSVAMDVVLQGDELGQPGCDADVADARDGDGRRCASSTTTSSSAPRPCCRRAMRWRSGAWPTSPCSSCGPSRAWCRRRASRSAGSSRPASSSRACCSTASSASDSMRPC